MKKNMIRPAILLAAALCAAAPCACAELEKAKPKLISGFSVRLAADATSNLYESNTGAQSASVFKTSIAGNLEYPASAATSYLLSFDLTQNDYTVLSDEDFKTVDVKFDVEKRFPGGMAAGIEARFGSDDAGSAALDTLAGKDSDIEGRLDVPLTRADTLKLKAWSTREDYKFYNSMRQETFGSGVYFSRDLGGFTTFEAGFETEKTRYPNEFIISLQGEDTSTRRDDRNESFVASISKVYSLYPLAYAMVNCELAKNKSNSNEYYLWYDPARGELLTKVVPGYDSFRERSVSFYGVRELDGKNMVSAYYMLDKYRYPGKLIGNYGDAEPVMPTTVTLSYLLLSFQHKLAPNLTLDLSETLTRSRSDEPAYSFEENVASLGFTAKF